jgi:hypothetical protein
MMPSVIVIDVLKDLLFSLLTHCKYKISGTGGRIQLHFVPVNIMLEVFLFSSNFVQILL